MKKICGFLFLASLSLWSADAWAASVRGAVEIDRQAVRLSDIFTDVPEGIDRDVATAPQAGKSVSYDVNVLTKLAQQYRLDWQPQSLRERCVVTRTGVAITADMIRQAAVKKIKEETQNLGASEIEVSLDGRVPDIFLPTGQKPDFTFNRFEYDIESQRFRSEVLAGEGGSFSSSVTGRVLVKRDIPVLARRLEAGTIISESDLIWVTMNAGRLSNDIVVDARELIGRALRRNTTENTPLRNRDVMQPRLVTRGSLVTMRVETPQIVATAQGRALQDGAIGEVVRLTNINSKRLVEGIVIGPGLVKVETTSTMVPQREPIIKQAAR